MNQSDEKIIESQLNKVDTKEKSNEIKLTAKKENSENKKSINAESKVKPIKELPIEKKPFDQFINEHLIPEMKNVFKEKGKHITTLEMSNTNRPIAGDKCWVIYCEIKETCCFWLSFDKDEITSPKSFSLCKTNENPSIIESFLIDEKKITLKLIISRILQRLNGQKLLGAN
tara:strand:- start:9947 stop:10462 length:516 start_codon:yes stop_codon:yes gene_type:complete